MDEIKKNSKGKILKIILGLIIAYGIYTGIMIILNENLFSLSFMELFGGLLYVLYWIVAPAIALILLMKNETKYAKGVKIYLAVLLALAIIGYIVFAIAMSS